MKLLGNMLIFLSTICFSDVCSMKIPAEWIVPDRKARFSFVLQHGSGPFGIRSPKIFGEFVGGLTEEAGAIIADGQKIDRSKNVSEASVLTLEDTLYISPQPLSAFVDSRKNFFSVDELTFHSFLHQDSGKLFLTFIEKLQIAGMRYYSPSKEFDDFLQKQVLPMKKEIEKNIPEERTLQKSCLGAIETLVAQAEGIQRIKNKTYCLAGVNLSYVDVEHGTEIKNSFFLLPYIFVSDGMESGVIETMERFLTENGTLSVGKVSNIDYYSMDMHDSIVTAKRVYATVNYVDYKDHPICEALTKETLQQDKIIVKFAHAEQRAIDRLALMLPDFITLIAQKSNVGNHLILKGIRVHMLVNNDSCCRCDAVIRATIEKGKVPGTRGWLERLLIASAKQSETFLDVPKKIDVDENVVITAAVSSVIPYNTGLDLNGMHFLSRGGIMREVIRKRKDLAIEKKDPVVNEVVKKEPVLKIYE